ncbi:hypothetical protein KI688_003628 [Linnemannia hyalina]|uniref:DUF6589 domain-containing protein n=1 Tax=Linnemannia hyalina TaxID=64524 RepID=A0A9P7XQL4_9FUNG|nr:hypothetical protein KI688_003628 [Linnemannia hyalina]
MYGDVLGGSCRFQGPRGQKKVDKFYQQNGPSRIVECWGKHLERKWTDYTFIESAVNVIRKRVQTDLNRIVNKKAFCHPANSISRKKIHNFSMKRLRRTLETTAPTLTQVLVALMPTNVTAKAQDSSPNMNDEDVFSLASRIDPEAPPSLVAAAPPSAVNLELESIVGSDDDLYADSESDSHLALDSNSDSDAESDALVDTVAAPITVTASVTAAPTLVDTVAGLNTLIEIPDQILDFEKMLLIESDAEDEDEHLWVDQERILANKSDPNPDPDPGSFVATVGSMLVFMRSERSNYLQMMMGLHLRGMSCPKQLITLLSVMNLSMSYKTTTIGLKSLAKDHYRLLRVAAHTRQMILCSAILRIHHGHIAQPGSLYYYKTKLGRRRLNLDSPCHHSADEFLRTVFAAMVKQMWQAKHNSNPQGAGSIPGDNFLTELNDLVSSNFFDSDTLRGLPHRWIAGDLYQEFNNLLTKRTHATVGFKTSTMAYITPLIRLFHVIHKKMRAEYKLTEESAFHRDVTPEGDILIIMNSLKESNILGVEKCPVAHEGVAPVQDLMVEGVQALQKGGFARFVKRMTEEESDRVDNTATELEEALSDEMLIRLDKERSRSEKYLNSLFN